MVLPKDVKAVRKAEKKRRKRMRKRRERIPQESHMP